MSLLALVFTLLTSQQLSVFWPKFRDVSYPLLACFELDTPVLLHSIFTSHGGAAAPVTFHPLLECVGVNVRVHSNSDTKVIYSRVWGSSSLSV